MPDASITDGKINVLGNLETVGVSLVKRGANKRLFALTKSESTMPGKLDAVLQTVLTDHEIENREKLEAVIKSEKLGDKGAAALEAIAKMRDAFKDEAGLKAALVKLIKAEDGEMFGKDDDEEEKKKKAKKGATPPAAAGDDETKKDKDGDVEKDDEEDESKKSKKALAKSLDGLPVEVKKHLAPILKAYEEQIESANERVKELQAIAKSETDLRVEREWIAKAEKHLTHVPGKKPQALAKSLKTIAEKMGAEAAEEHFQTLKASSDAVKKSAMLRDVGAGNTGDSTTTAWDMLQQKAEQIITKSERSLTREQALVKAMELYPDLYEASQQEQAHRTNR